MCSFVQSTIRTEDYKSGVQNSVQKAFFVLALAALLAGCGSSAPRRSAAPSEPRPARHCSSAPHPLGSVSTAYAAIVRRRISAFRSPGGRPLARFGRINQNGVPTVLGVLGVRKNARCAPAWYRVQLPLRPNGLTGWVRAADVQVEPVETRIVIHVRARRLELLRSGRVVLRTPISTGAAETPTPLGRFYVKERLIPADPNGPWGPAGLGVSAYSPVLKDWPQGGPLGIHGTNDPSAIGRAASHGCIRVPNGVMKELFAQTLAGTPVIIGA
jgi:hypothetical protein